jgi:hypothetical protein
MADYEQIMDFLNTNRLTISKDPINNLDRKIELINFSWMPKKEISLRWKVWYYDAEGKELDNVRMRPYSRQLSTGRPNDPTQEYNYFIQIANGAQNIFSLIIDTALLRDSQQKFDI